MHGLLALAVQRAAYKRVGKLPADARSAEAGSELVIMQQGEGSGISDQNYVWHGGASNMTCSGSTSSFAMRLRGNQLEVSGKVLPEAQEIPRHGS